ncbi:hypothetical protein Tco_0927090 [Tanacetum coccineum]|uniref:Uncharacterized protein n=1 Tax=Tanacetum coccineum TaxID=301880 RepID=A0ABQ5DBP5_9ASTR
MGGVGGGGRICGGELWRAAVARRERGGVVGWGAMVSGGWEWVGLKGGGGWEGVRRGEMGGAWGTGGGGGTGWRWRVWGAGGGEDGCEGDGEGVGYWYVGGGGGGLVVLGGGGLGRSAEAVEGWLGGGFVVWAEFVEFDGVVFDSAWEPWWVKQGGGGYGKVVVWGG